MAHAFRDVSPIVHDRLTMRLNITIVEHVAKATHLMMGRQRKEGFPHQKRTFPSTKPSPKVSTHSHNSTPAEDQAWSHFAFRV